MCHMTHKNRLALMSLDFACSPHCACSVLSVGYFVNVVDWQMQPKLLRRGCQY